MLRLRKIKTFELQAPLTLSSHNFMRSTWLLFPFTRNEPVTNQILLVSICQQFRFLLYAIIALFSFTTVWPYAMSNMIALFFVLSKIHSFSYTYDVSKQSYSGSNRRCRVLTLIRRLTQNFLFSLRRKVLSKAIRKLENLLFSSFRG